MSLHLEGPVKVGDFRGSPVRRRKGQAVFLQRLIACPGCTTRKSAYREADTGHWLRCVVLRAVGYGVN